MIQAVHGDCGELDLGLASQCLPDSLSGGTTLITPAHRKESLCRAYVQAVAGHVGMICVFHAPNDYGIDVTLREVTKRKRGKAGKIRHCVSGRALDIQLKSTTRAVLDDDVVKYYLDVKAYNDLRLTPVATPRILTLFVLAESEEEQFRQNEDALCLRHCCYWVSLEGRGQVDNPSKTLIELPRKNVFSEDNLRGILRRLERKESL